LECQKGIVRFVDAFVMIMMMTSRQVSVACFYYSILILNVFIDTTFLNLLINHFPPPLLLLLLMLLMLLLDILVTHTTVKESVAGMQCKQQQQWHFEGFLINYFYFR